MPAERAQLLDLAERVEKAEGASRELDAEIMAIQHFQDDRCIGGQIGDGRGEWMPIKDRVWVSRATDKWVGTHPRDFTSSLDAALTLMPEGFDWIIEHTNGGLTIGAMVGHNSRDRMSWGGNAALALCAASLRALAAQHPEEGSSDAG